MKEIVSYKMSTLYFKNQRVTFHQHVHNKQPNSRQREREREKTN